MKTLISIILTLALHVQAAVLWTADLVPDENNPPLQLNGSVAYAAIGHADFEYVAGQPLMTVTWGGWDAADHVMLSFMWSGGDYRFGATLPSGGGSFVIPQWTTSYLNGAEVEVGYQDSCNFGLLRGTLREPTPAVPEPATGALVAGLGLGLFAMTRRLRSVILVVLCGLCISEAVYAADDDPDAIPSPTTTTTVESITPVGFTMTMVVTPITKVNNANVANVTTVYVTKWQEKRVLINGSQSGDVKRVSLGTRDITAWLAANKTNVNGNIIVGLTGGNATWVSVAWNKSVEVKAVQPDGTPIASAR